jgi:teichuronic acid biosynthesis glycosyltransferase TuaC
MIPDAMRALVVSNMRPAPTDPGRGIYVREQVTALRRIPGLDVDLYQFPPGPAAYPAAVRELRRRSGAYDLVHAHFGLTAWPTLAIRGVPHVVTLHGNDLYHPRTRRLTLAVARRMDLVATASAALGRDLPDGPWRRAVLPCGVGLDRFNPIPREHARMALGLDPDRPCLLFPFDPARRVKRFDRAQAVAGDTQLITLGATEPAHVALAINAANAVIVPSDFEGFGLAVLEALACGVPVLATPVGAHPLALGGLAGTLCAEFDRDRWREALAPHLAAADPRVLGRPRAELFSADRMAARVAVAWRQLVDDRRSARTPRVFSMS